MTCGLQQPAVAAQDQHGGGQHEGGVTCSRNGPPIVGIVGSRPGGRYAGGALTRWPENMSRSSGLCRVTVASDKTQRLVAVPTSEEFGLRQVFRSGIAQARSARQAARIDVAGITGFGGAIAALPVFLMSLLRLGACWRAGSACRFGLPPESGPGQFDA